MAQARSGAREREAVDVSSRAMTPHQWIADSGRLIAFAADGSLLVTGQHPERLTRYVGPAWTMAGQVNLQGVMSALAASPTDDEVCLGDKTGMFYRAAPLKKRSGSLKGHKYELGAVAYAPDGQRVFTGGGGHITPPDHTIRCFDLAGRELARVAGPRGTVRRLGPLDDSVVVALDTADGLAAYDVPADRRLWMVPASSPEQTQGPFAVDAREGRVYAALQTEDYDWVLAVLDARTGVEIGRAELFSSLDSGHVDDVVLIGGYVALAMGQNVLDPWLRKAKVHLFDRATLACGALARGPVLEGEEQTRSLAAAPDGHTLAATMQNLGIAVFDLRALA